MFPVIHSKNCRFTMVFRGHFAVDKIRKWDILRYVYRLLHHPGY